jgi:NADPH:quinone reductase-like Zn-dependent oxidoreductase
MRAVVIEAFGEPAEVVRVQDVPDPKPGRGSVRVRMLASPINPSDLLMIGGNYGIRPSLPATPGFEGVGVVEQSGGGLLGWMRTGKRVAVLNGTGGNWAEQVIVPAHRVVPVPSDLTDEQAATFFVNPATAIVMIRRILRVPKGAWLLQSAAGSALGKMIVRMGKLDGFRTINIVRRREQVEELTQLGADAVLVESDGSIPERVRERTGGVRHAIDPVGGDTGTAVVASLEAGGRALLYGLLSGQPIQVDPRYMISGGLRVEGFWLSIWAQSQGPLTMLGLFREVKGLMRQGVLSSEVAASYPLEQVAEAVRHAGSAGKGGKVLLRLSGGHGA